MRERVSFGVESFQQGRERTHGRIRLGAVRPSPRETREQAADGDCFIAERLRVQLAEFFRRKVADPVNKNLQLP